MCSVIVAKVLFFNSYPPSIYGEDFNLQIHSYNVWHEMAGFCYEISKLKVFLIAKDEKQNFPQNEFNPSTLSCAHLTAHTFTAGVVWRWYRILRVKINRASLGRSASLISKWLHCICRRSPAPPRFPEVSTRLYSRNTSVSLVELMFQEQ